MAFFARPLSLLTLLILGAGLVIGPGSVARAQDRLEAPSSQHYSFDFRGVTLKDALEHLIDSTPISLVYDLAMVAGKRVACRVEDATAEATLRCIVRGTGLDADRLSSGTFVLRKAQRQTLRPVPPRKHTISGLVYDAASGASLSQAHVYEAEQRLGTITDTSGYFRLGVWIDSVRLAVSHLGYEKARLVLNLRGDTVRHVGLNPAMLWLDSLRVVAERVGDDDEHPTRGRALYGHVRGVFLSLRTRRLNTGGAEIVAGYRFLGQYDVGLSVSGGGPHLMVGPLLGYATRPSKAGWGGRLGFVYHVGFDLGRMDVRPFGFDAEALVYKRSSVGATRKVFPSVGFFLSSSHVVLLSSSGGVIYGDDKLRASGLQFALPFTVRLKGRGKLVLEPLYRMGSFRLIDTFPYRVWSLEIRLNL